MEAFKTRLNNAFKEMRKQGLITRQNYLCCQTCAGYGITTDVVEMIKNGRKKKEDIKGCVFYHHQDNELLKRNHSFYLAFGSLDSKELGLIGLNTKDVGKIVCDCLSKNQIEHSWNGEETERILVVETE